LGESLTLVQLSGGALILVGVFVAEHSRNRTRAELIVTS